MNQCMIYGQIYSLIVTPVKMGQVRKEANTRKTRIISNKRKWYQFHTGTKGELDGVTK